MRAVNRFFMCKNGFKGTIPESGIRKISSVTEFAVQENSFEGTLPESGLQAMRTMSSLFMHRN
eukprot:5797351-Amphidinium_carterae.1